RGHTAARVKGDGLGLTVVHHIVKAHGGMIQVESEAGKGSTFMLTLPLRQEGIRAVTGAGAAPRAT
ncbi:MAG: two-component sensor histidine kinase, partial [Deltaproteobacteria bacterium]|nr:two-component sensor histidine kinase [Deltaproteobacteria bacterium]